VSILSADGTILARGPWVAALTGTSITGIPEYREVPARSAGLIRLRGTPTQVEQIASFRRLLE